MWDPAANAEWARVVSDELEALLRKDLAPELQLMRLLGRGSMASVYLAREPELKRLVAVKVLSPKLASDSRARKRFEREAQSVASLSHSNIVAIHRVGRLSNGLPFIVMQYVKGGTMADRLRAEGKLSVAQARRTMAEIASAIDAAHRKGIVHRDVRPANILYEEATGRCLLADFGIAAILASGEGGQATRLTRSGELIGDPAYMSPQQLTGGEVTERSDVYGLGLLGYELLTGRRLYEASTKREMFEVRRREEPRGLSELPGGPELQELLRRCLASEPEHRPSAADVAMRLTSASGDTPPVAAIGVAPSRGVFSNLAERRVPHIVAVYGAAGMGALEVVSQLVERSILPEVAYRLALVSFAVGFPAVLVGAWFHGKKGRQRFSRVEYWLFGALALVWLAVSALVLVKWLSVGSTLVQPGVPTPP